jgi:hypothetical protein
MPEQGMSLCLACLPARGLPSGRQAQGPVYLPELSEGMALIRYAGPAGPGGRSGHESSPFDQFHMRNLRPTGWHDYLRNKGSSLFFIFSVLFSIK